MCALCCVGVQQPTAATWPLPRPSPPLPALSPLPPSLPPNSKQPTVRVWTLNVSDADRLTGSLWRCWPASGQVGAAPRAMWCSCCRAGVDKPWTPLTASCPPRFAEAYHHCALLCAMQSVVPHEPDGCGGDKDGVGHGTGGGGWECLPADRGTTMPRWQVGLRGNNFAPSPWRKSQHNPWDYEHHLGRGL